MDKIRMLSNLSKTSPHSAYHLYQYSIKHQITFIQRIGLTPAQCQIAKNQLKFFAEKLLGRVLKDEKILEQLSWPKKVWRTGYGNKDI